MIILEAENITKHYGEAVVIQGISISLEYGQTMGLKAESGSGKTTLLHILAGLDKDFSGNVFNHALKRGIVFQDLALFRHKTVSENIVYPLHREGGELDSLYQDWLQLTGLNGYEEHYPHQLSRGMCQKVALIRAFLPKPEIVFLDEPVSALDKESKENIFNFIKEKYERTSILMASHSDWELKQICSTVLNLPSSSIL